MVDTGYCIHAEQTLALVEAALQGAPLQRIVNTHLHSDHCGGNALLQQRWPQVRTSIAPGHDPHSIILFEPQTRTLISADALWEAGFGVVFPEIEGIAAFDEVAATLDVIEQLQPAVVLPGHGGIFTDVATALATARRRLDGFVRHPERHALYAAKVLLKYKLLEWQQLPLVQVYAWLAATPYYGLLHQAHFADQSFADWCAALVADLQRSGAAQLVDGVLVNSG